MQVTLKLYATLADYLPPSARRDNQVELDVAGDATLEAVTAPFGLPNKLCHLVLVNGVFVPREERSARRVQEGDVIAIWPPVAGG